MKHEEAGDEILISRFRDGDEKALELLMERYKPLVRRHANMLFLVGGDTDDLIQEGMIGLYKAIRGFDEKKESSFSHFAKLSVTRQMYTAIEASNRKKNAPLNSSVSIETEEDRPGEDSPEEWMLRQERITDLIAEAKQKLSPLEKKVFSCLLNGMTYREIAEILNKSAKSIDNAIQRMKQKLAGSC